jgi:hypothetical protein
MQLLFQHNSGMLSRRCKDDPALIRQIDSWA